MGSSAGYAGYHPSYECSDTTDPGGWRSSPVFDPPVWPVNTAINDEYTGSPLPSPEIYTSQGVVSQNCFDQSFSEALQSSSMTSSSTETLRASPSSYLQPDWDPNWTQGNIQPAPSYVPLSLIHDPLTQRNHDGTRLTEGPLYSPSSSLTFTGESSPPVTIKKEGEQQQSQHQDVTLTPEAPGPGDTLHASKKRNTKVLHQNDQACLAPRKDTSSAALEQDTRSPILNRRMIRGKKRRTTPGHPTTWLRSNTGIG
jgi:hypothetical protein